MELQLIQSKIHTLRGQKVILDFDLAALYEVPTKALNQAVKRNNARFPEDFMFQLDTGEWQAVRAQIESLKTMPTNRSQFVTGSQKHREPKALPFAFTEQGVAMLSGVLRSQKAVEVNIAIMRTFVALRNYIISYAELKQQIINLENKFGRELTDVFEVLRWLGEENQARYDEIQALHTEDEPPRDWEERARIGFRKEV